MLLKKRGYFNSRPHEEVDEGNKIHGLQEDISTHDLTKRSTSALYADTPKLSISTHDLTKRSTKYAALFKLADSTISTHDLTKRSTAGYKSVELMKEISTHDLTKRSTPVRRYSSVPGVDFNSRPHEEVDILREVPQAQRGLFQLTTSRRGRRQFLRKKFSFPNYFLCLLHIIYSYYINTIFFSTLFFAKSSFFLVRIP